MTLLMLMNLGFAGGGAAVTDVFFENKQSIEVGMKAQTASEMGGVLCE